MAHSSCVSSSLIATQIRCPDRETKRRVYKYMIHHAKLPLPIGKIFRPELHPFGLRVDNRLSAFSQAREQVLIGLRAGFEEWPKLLDEIKPALPEKLLGFCPTQQEHLGLLHVLAQLSRAS